MEQAQDVTKRYQTLRSTSRMLGMLAWGDLVASAIFGIILGILVAQAGTPFLSPTNPNSLPVSVLLFAVVLVVVVYAGIWWFLVLRTWAEGIMAFIDIEENTRVMRHKMEAGS